MSNRRLEMYRLQELVRLYRLGTGVRERCKALRMSSRSEKMYRDILGHAGLLGGDVTELPELETLKAAVLERYPPTPRAPRPSSVDLWMDEIQIRFEKGAGPKATYEYLLREVEGFNGSLQAVKRAFKRLSKARGVKATDVALVVETAPGDVAQVDFGSIGRIRDSNGELRAAHVFVMVLGHSRLIYAKAVFDQSASTWQQLHVDAFESLGGVPRTVVPDNLKSAVIRASFGMVDRDKLTLNRSYTECARHYGFKIDPTPAYAPEKKGKVESGVKYVKSNFFKPYGGEFQSLAEVNEKLTRWCAETANPRTHGTTYRRPIDVFEAEERDAMLPLPRQRYEEVVWYNAVVHRDAHVVYKRRYYSVPWRLIGDKVWLRITASELRIYADDQRVASHDPRGAGLRCTQASHLPPKRRELANRSVSHWLEQAELLGEDVGRLAHAIVDSDSVLSKLAEVQSLVMRLQSYPAERAAAACVRALRYGVLSANGVGRILEDGLDLEAVTDGDSTPLILENPRFARTPHELLHIVKEGTHGPH